MNVYYDTSAIVCSILDEPMAPVLAALRLGSGGNLQIVSDFARGEVAACLAQQVRVRRVAANGLPVALALLDAATKDWTFATISPDDIARATDHVLRVEIGLRLPDAIHIAIASRLDAALVTLDKNQHRAAVALGIPVAGPLVNS